MSSRRNVLFYLLLGGALAACGGDDGPASLLPTSYETSFTEVRDCRRSGDHDFEYIRILADASAASVYLAREGQIPEGAMLIKEQYDASDQECAGEIVQWTLAKRLPIGSSPATLDYEWQRVLADGRVDADSEGCVNCHSDCGVPPDGFDGTCALP